MVLTTVLFFVHHHHVRVELDNPVDVGVLGPSHVGDVGLFAESGAG